MPGGDQVTPDKAPWILIGGSYSGMYWVKHCHETQLTLNSQQAHSQAGPWSANRVFSSRGTHPLVSCKPSCKIFNIWFDVVLTQVSSNFWQYFEPVRQHMPSNCSADVQAVVAYVDTVLTSDNATAIQTLKESFGMGEVTHLDDVAGSRKRDQICYWKLLNLVALKCETISGIGNPCRWILVLERNSISSVMFWKSKTGYPHRQVVGD